MVARFFMSARATKTLCCTYRTMPIFCRFDTSGISSAAPSKPRCRRFCADDVAPSRRSPARICAARTSSMPTEEAADSSSLAVASALAIILPAFFHPARSAAFGIDYQIQPRMSRVDYRPVSRRCRYVARAVFCPPDMLPAAIRAIARRL